MARLRADSVRVNVDGPGRGGALASLRDTICFYVVLILFWVMCLAWSLPAAAL